MAAGKLDIAGCMQTMQSACMKTVQVRGVPEATHAILRRRAAAAGMTLQEYLRSLLDEVAAVPTVTEVLERAGGRAGGTIGLERAARQLRDERSER
jgi:antitoxin FitA